MDLLLLLIWMALKLKVSFSNGGISKQRGLLGGEYGTENRRNSTLVNIIRSQKSKYIPTFVSDFIPNNSTRAWFNYAETYQFH